MFAWWRDQCRETIEELQRGRHQAHAAGLHALVDQMPGVDFAQPFQRKGGPGAIPQQTFQTAALVGLDAYLCIDREAAAVLPLGHHLRVLRRQEAAPQGRVQQSSAHGGLNLPDRGHILRPTAFLAAIPTPTRGLPRRPRNTSALRRRRVSPSRLAPHWEISICLPIIWRSRKAGTRATTQAG